jgi:hypothetical protein
MCEYEKKRIMKGRKTLKNCEWGEEDETGKGRRRDGDKA